jgi:TonB family protein
MNRAASAGGSRLKPLALLGGALLLGACSTQLRRPVAPAPVVVTPVEVTTTYIASYGHHYQHGQFAVVQVCVAADGVIASTRILVSSTQKVFDDSALNWARQARYQPQLENGRAVYGCREVRVEINHRRDGEVGRGADSALG